MRVKTWTTRVRGTHSNMEKEGRKVEVVQVGMAAFVRSLSPKRGREAERGAEEEDWRSHTAHAACMN